MADKPFRVLLDLSDVSLDNFKYVWINISPRELKTIYDLKMRILQKIMLERVDIDLFVRDGQLLDEETISILREDDTVKVKYRSGGNPGKNSQKRNLCETNVNDKNKKIHQPEIVASTSNEGNFSSNKKKSETVTISNEDSFNEKTAAKKVKRKKKSQSFHLNTEINHSTLVKEIHDIKKSHKEKEKKETSSKLNHSVAGVNFSKTNDSIFSFNGECSAQKQNKNISSKTALVKPADVIVISDNSSEDDTNEPVKKDYPSEPGNVNIGIRSDSLNNRWSSKCKRQSESGNANIGIRSDSLNNRWSSNCKRQSESENANIGIINSDSLNNRWSSKYKRQKKQKQTEKINISDKYDAHTSKSFSGSVDENVNRKHTLYSLSPVKVQERNDFDHTSQFENSSTNTFVHKEDFSDDYLKISTPGQSNTWDDPDCQEVSVMPCVSISAMSCVSISAMPRDYNLLSNNENNVIIYEESTSKATASQIIKSNKAEKKYDDLKPVQCLPQVGTYIAYKCLELDEHYSPRITQYKEGLVESIDPDTDEITIHLCEEVVIPGRTGKFENLQKDEIPPPTVQRYDTLKWCDMISPKFLNHLAE